MALKKSVKVKSVDSPNESLELKSQLARALADYDNLRKRTEAEKESWFKVAGIRIISKLLPLLDMLESAQKHLNDGGLAIVLGEFRKAIEDEGLEEIKIDKENTEFDSELMEAIEVVETKDENLKNKVSEILMTGWKMKDENGEKDL